MCAMWVLLCCLENNHIKCKDSTNALYFVSKMKSSLRALERVGACKVNLKGLLRPYWPKLNTLQPINLAQNRDTFFIWFLKKIRRNSHWCHVSFWLKGSETTTVAKKKKKTKNERRKNQRAEAFSCSAMESRTAFKSRGISFSLATIMPVSKSRYFPFEKSSGFPAASVTIPPASAHTNKKSDIAFIIKPHLHVGIVKSAP